MCFWQHPQSRLVFRSNITILPVKSRCHEAVEISRYGPFSLASELMRFMRLVLRSRTALVAENLFLRKQACLLLRAQS